MTMPSDITTDPNQAAEVLLRGGIIGLPTETVYGLAAMALNQRAVERVYEVKGRPRHHPLIVHLAELEMARQWGILNEAAMMLATQIWPGPLTLLVPRTDVVPVIVTGGRDSVALRVPAHPGALQVLALVDSGVVAPSANRFGKVSPTTAEHVAHDLGREVDLVLDGGPCAIGLESTIVECIGEHLQILRPGAVTAIDIKDITNLTLVSENQESRAPGMMISHYAPNASVMLAHSWDEAVNRMSAIEDKALTCRILWYEDVDLYALSLYDDLRRADLDGVSIVIAVLPSQGGIGDAVRDRLRKAAAGR